MSNTTAVRKAVFPVAGLGSRFLPATKANPKEMLPIVDKPLIQYAVEEAIDAGCTEMIFITSSSKRAIEDHFDRHFELETRLQQKSKDDLLALTQNVLPKGINCIYMRQPEPLGLGDAVLRAKSVVGNEPFAVLLADDLIATANENSLQQMARIYQQHQGRSVIAVETIAPEETHKYGVVDVEHTEGSTHLLKAIVEKPPKEQAPSLLGVAGRYILSPDIFACLEATPKGQGHEIQLTDAIERLLKQQAVYAYEFAGQRYDCGSKFGYLKATVEMALQHPELQDRFKAYLETLAS